jgi:uncharacterized membrane protein/Mg-chelatase subunit ChlD
MGSYQLTFPSPWPLLLLALLPLAAWLSFRRPTAMGRFRRLVALGLRCLVLALLVLALADTQAVRRSDQLTVLYVLDQSLSIPPAHRRAMTDYVNEAVRRHRKGKDRAGVIVFGREAAVEIPPYDDDVDLAPVVEGVLDPEATNLAAAMKLALAAFPEDAARRIVLVTDGNQNQGDGLEQARTLATAGVAIDVVPVRYAHRADVAVERVVLPGNVRRGQPFDLKVVVTNSADARPDDSGRVGGRLILSRISDDQPVVLNGPQDQHVTLEPGKRVFSFRQQIDAPNFYTYEARFVPDRPEDDAMPQNNRATAFTQVRGRGQVLLIVDRAARSDYDLLVQRLRGQDLEITVRGSDQLFASLAELQPFDAVLLANVPRDNFTDTQIQMLVRNTQQMGAGLVMLGGPSSFGAGGWTNTPLEEAMPVDFQVKNAKVVPRGALVMLMHASEIPEGNHWQKVIADQAIGALGDRDYCGVIHWGGAETWLWHPGLREVGPNRHAMLALVDRMVPGDMPAFESAMTLAHQAFLQLPDAAVKHMIIISDGDPQPPSAGLVTAMTGQKVTISTVAVAAHGPAESQNLATIAQLGGGKFYQVNNPNLLPRIYQREARRVARPLVHENKDGFRPQVRFTHEILRGIEGPLPPLSGFVLTSKKQNPLVETAIVSPEPADDMSNTILATWTYGLGKAVAFTSDAGQRWAAAWTTWENYDKLFSQLVRWAMRPVVDSGKFQVATEVRDGRVRVVVSALDQKDRFLNFLNVTGTVVGPRLEPLPLGLEQTAPGRYVGSFPASNPGSYFLLISPGAGQSPLRTGVNVPYSDEFRDRLPNDGLLEQLAGMVPQGGPAGRLLPPLLDAGDRESLLAADSFRHDLPKATHSQDIWHYLALAACWLFLADVFVRRVQVGFGWVGVAWRQVVDWIARRPAPAVKIEYIERLRSRKAEVTGQLDQIRAGARFEAPPEAPGGVAMPPRPAGAAPQSPGAAPAAPSIAAEKKAEEESYTERLLRAKKKVWEDRGEK